MSISAEEFVRAHNSGAFVTNTLKMNIGRTKSAFRDFADHSSAILCAHLEARFSHRLAVSRLQFQECTSFDSRSSVLGTVRFRPRLRSCLSSAFPSRFLITTPFCRGSFTSFRACDRHFCLGPAFGSNAASQQTDDKRHYRKQQSFAVSRNLPVHLTLRIDRRLLLTLLDRVRMADPLPCRASPELHFRRKLVALALPSRRG